MFSLASVCITATPVCKDMGQGDLWYILRRWVFQLQQKIERLSRPVWSGNLSYLDVRLDRLTVCKRREQKVYISQQNYCMFQRQREHWRQHLLTKVKEHTPSKSCAQQLLLKHNEAWRILGPFFSIVWQSAFSWPHPRTRTGLREWTASILRGEVLYVLSWSPGQVQVLWQKHWGGKSAYVQVHRRWTCALSCFSAFFRGFIFQRSSVPVFFLPFLLSQKEWEQSSGGTTGLMVCLSTFCMQVY